MTNSMSIMPPQPITPILVNEEYTTSIKAILNGYPGIPLQRPPRLSEEQIRRVSEILAQAGKDSWSLIPRVYATLYMVNRTETIGAFVQERITDLWFPFSIRTLPEGFRSPSDQYAFIEAQDLVLTKAFDLEREDGKHRHFADSTEIPLVKKQELGKGGFGSVDRVLSTISHREYARKLIRRGKTFRKNAAVLRDFERELSHLKKLRHHHIVQFVGSYTDSKYVGILMSPVADSNLKDFLARENLTIGERSLLRTFYGCLAVAVQYLHEKQVRHKDIKPQNVLVKGAQVLLTDFGLAIDWAEHGQSTTTGQSTGMTERYCAPEVASNESRNTQADLWSLGCVFLEIWTTLKGESVANLIQHLSSSGSESSCYHRNTDAIAAWCEIIKERKGIKSENQPLAWISGTLQREKSQRWTARQLVTRLLDANDAHENSVLFIGTCCNQEDSTESEVSSKRSSRLFEDTGITDIIPYQPKDGRHMPVVSSAISPDDSLRDARAFDRVSSPADSTTSLTADHSSRESGFIANRPLSHSFAENTLSSETVLLLRPIKESPRQSTAMESDRFGISSQSHYVNDSERSFDRPQVSLTQSSRHHELDLPSSSTPTLLPYQPSITERDNQPFDSPIHRHDLRDRVPEGIQVEEIQDPKQLKEGLSSTQLNFSTSSRLPSLSKQSLGQLDESDEGKKDEYNAVPNLQPFKVDSPMDWKRSVKLKGHTDIVYSAVFSPDGKLLASASSDKTVRLWDVATGQARSTLLGHSDTVWSVAFSPDGKLLASASVDTTVRLWDVATGQARSTLLGHYDVVSSVAFSPDGKLLASASVDTTVRLWDVATGQARSTLLGHSNKVQSVAFSPDGKLLASASVDTTVRLWDVATGQARSTLLGHSDTVLSVAFSPDGKLLASASYDKRVRLWDVATGQARSTLLGHSNIVWSVAFSPDGKLLASASWDKKVRLWDVATGQARSTLLGHSDTVWSVAFLPDGKLLASASYDKTVRLWGGG